MVVDCFPKCSICRRSITLCNCGEPDITPIKQQEPRRLIYTDVVAAELTRLHEALEQSRGLTEELKAIIVDRGAALEQREAELREARELLVDAAQTIPAYTAIGLAIDQWLAKHKETDGDDIG